MEKKNPYVMTIGFRKNNADHIRVAEFLNSLGREKAQYIVKAVLSYQLMEERGNAPKEFGSAYDYESIRRIVLQILQEQNVNEKVFPVRTDSVAMKEGPVQIEENPLLGFDEDAMMGIMASINAFQNNE